MSILKLCSNYCQNVDNVDSYRINGCALFHIANIQSHSHAEINPGPLVATKNAIQLLEKVLSEEEELIVSDYQLLSHALLLQSSLEQDDEVAIELYDKAGEYLHVALEMDPSNL